MGLWTSFESWITGVDIEAEQARADKADATLHDLNLNAYQSGQWTLQQYQQAEADLARSSAITADIANQVSGAFKQGALEGLAAEQAAVKSALNNVAGFSLKTVFGFFPWWLWLVAGAGAFLYFGGAGVLKRNL